jgi:hypothetical protein
MVIQFTLAAWLHAPTHIAAAIKVKKVVRMPQYRKEKGARRRLFAFL